MADSEPRQPTEPVEVEEQRKLKYLDFFQVAAIYAIVFFSSIYEYAKENSGPLKPGVQTVEGTVKTVIGPVYEKFHDVPFEILKFVDRKVDESLMELDRHMPVLLKQASGQAFTVARNAPELAQAVVSEVQRAGVIDATKHISKDLYTKYEPTAKELYTKYEPVAEQYAVSAWRKLNRLPFFPQAAQIITPTAAYWSEKYNEGVSRAAERGCAVASSLPLIPIDRIVKVFEEAECGPTFCTNGKSVSVTR